MKRTALLRQVLLWAIAAVLVAAALALSACGSSAKDSDSAKATTATQDFAPKEYPSAKTVDEIKTADDWKTQFPEQVATFEDDTKPIRPVEDYLEIYPFLNTIYAGSGFAKSYDTPRPHLDALEDAKGSGRVNDQTKITCYSCKTAQYTVEEQNATDDSFYQQPFASKTHDYTMSVGCYDCHKNYPGSGSRTKASDNGTYLGSTRKPFDTAFAKIIKAGQMDPADAACGQCHNEYYFDQKTGEASMLEDATDPFTIFDTYKEMGIVDHVNPDTGAKMLKAQHPEYNMVASNTGVHSTMGLNCADCHMEQSNGVTSHKITTPVLSKEIRANKCLNCHTEGDAALVKLLKSTKEGLVKRINTGGKRLASFTNDLAKANKSGDYSDAELDPIREKECEAQWFLDYVLVENSKGVHNPTQADKCLNRSLSVVKDGEALLAKLK